MLPRTPLTETVGLALCRVVVPLWILLGVVFKTLGNDPRLLPGVIWQNAREMGIDLGTLLYTLIGLEIFAIGVMVLLSRFARLMAIFMLASFCAILIAEMARGAESCGCFGGAITIKPWQMFIADFILLAAVALFPVKRSGTATAEPTAGEASRRPLPVGQLAAGVVILVAGLVTSFVINRALHPDRAQEPEPPQVTVGSEVNNDEGPDEQIQTAARHAVDPTRNPSPKALPGFWYVRNINGWVGRPWRELEIFQFMPRWPRGMDEGTTFVVFYNRTCEHCQDMFEFDLTRDLGAPVVAIEVPYSKDVLTSADAWDMLPQDQLVAVDQSLNLPLGTDWIIQSPLAMRIENGTVACATEGDHKECFELE